MQVEGKKEELKDILKEKKYPLSLCTNDLTV